MARHGSLRTDLGTWDPDRYAKWSKGLEPRPEVSIRWDYRAKVPPALALDISVGEVVSTEVRRVLEAAGIRGVDYRPAKIETQAGRLPYWSLVYPHRLTAISYRSHIRLTRDGGVIGVGIVPRGMTDDADFYRGDPELGGCPIIVRSSVIRALLDGKVRHWRARSLDRVDTHDVPRSQPCDLEFVDFEAYEQWRETQGHEVWG